MKKLTSYSKRVKYTYVKTTLATLFVSLFFLKGYAAFEKTGENYFHVFLNGNEIGTVGEADRVEQLLQEARRNIASQSDDMIFMDADLKLVGEEVLWEHWTMRTICWRPWNGNWRAVFVRLPTDPIQ